MSQSFLAQPRPRSGPAGGSGVLANLIVFAESWLIRRQGWHDLAQLDDRLRDDVGISRETVPWKADMPFWWS